MTDRRHFKFLRLHIILMGRGNDLILPVLVALSLGSRICYSLTTYEPGKAGITRNAGSVNLRSLLHLQNEREGNKDEPKFFIKHRVRRGFGDELNTWKGKAKKANSVYKWIKENWKKLFVIIVAIFALIVVVGIYRRCFSDSDSEVDVEPSVVVLKMQKPETKASGEFLDPIIREEVTRANNESIKEGKSVGHVTHDSETKGRTGKRIADKVVNTGEGRNQTSVALATTRDVRFQDIPDFSFAASESFSKDERFPHVEMVCNPVSGYTAFQQSDFSLLYFDLFKHLFEIKTHTDQLRVQSTMICKGSMSKGPSPFYEEIPLIKILATLTEKYCKDYEPVANTSTNIPLTVSP